MCREQLLVLLCQILVLLNVVNYSMGIVYEFLLEDEEIFSECSNNPGGYLNVHGMFDFSELKSEMVEGGVILSGNLTSLWNIHPTDRIEGILSVFYFDRGTWQNTVLNMGVRDFCKVMYEENQFWYQFWTSHIINKNEVKDQCVNLGTKLILETYLIDMKLPLDVPVRAGRHKILYHLHAIDRAGKRRKNSICFEVRGEIHKAS